MATARTKKQLSPRLCWGFHGSFEALIVRTRAKCRQGELVPVLGCQVLRSEKGKNGGKTLILYILRQLFCIQEQGCL